MMATTVKDRLCVALDVATLAEAERVVDEVVEQVGGFKIGMQLFTAEGPTALHVVKGRGGRVLLDLQYHDIPNTVSQAGREAVRHGVDVFTVHASGGKAMMASVVDSVRGEAERGGTERPKVLAITPYTR